MNKPKVYFAHNFSAQSFLRTSVLDQVTNAGLEVTSSWLYGSVLGVHSGPELWAKYEHNAKVNKFDVERSDVLFFFAHQYGNTPGRGKYIEFGIALGNGIPIVWINDAPVTVTDDLRKQCIFYELASFRAESVGEAIAWTKGYMQGIAEVPVINHSDAKASMAEALKEAYAIRDSLTTSETEALKQEAAGLRV